MSLIFPLDNIDFWNKVNGVSPDGKFYAFFSGTAGEWGYLKADGEYDLQLNIISLENGSVIKEIPLLSESYPSNFQQSAKSLRNQMGSEFEWATDDEVAFSLYHAFLVGIASIDWSPNGRYFAYAGQMDGPSSDLYIFDSNNNSIRRLTSGPEQIQRITWSPDSKQIMHASSYWIGVNPPYTNHSAKVEGSSVVSFPFDQGELEDGWLNNYQYLAHEGANGIGEYDIKLFDTRDGTIRVIWPYPFQYYEFHPSNNLLLVTMIEPPNSEMDPGVFLVDPDTTEFIRLGTGFWTLVEPLDNEDYLFAVGQWDYGTYLLTTENDLEQISDQNRFIEAAPDMKLLALYGSRKDAGLDIYSIEDHSTLPIFEYEVDRVFWVPDSSAIFFLSDESLYFYDLSSGVTVEVDEIDDDPYPRWGGFKFIHVEQ